MGELREVGQIHVHEDLAFLRAEWRAQRIGWIVMVAVLVLGLLGAFGGGLLAQAEAGDRRSFAVGYDRITRHGADSELRIHIGAALPRDSTFRIVISRAYLNNFDVQTIIPEPAASGFSGSAVYYEFENPERQGSLTVVFQVRGRGYWRISGDVAIGSMHSLRINQLILP